MNVKRYLILHPNINIQHLGMKTLCMIDGTDLAARDKGIFVTYQMEIQLSVPPLLIVSLTSSGGHYIIMT